MNCTICGQATLPGAMLCRPCKAALKRARYLSVQDLPRASILRPRRRRQPNAASAAPVGAPVATSERRSMVGRPLAAGAAAIAILALVAIFGQQKGGAGATAAPGESTPKASLIVPAPAEMRPQADEVAAPAPESEAQPANRSAVTTPTLPAPPVTAPSPSPAVRTSRPVPALPAAPAAPRPEAAATMGTGATADGLDPVAAPPRPAPPPPAPVAPPAPPPDRWQTLATKLAQCAREGGFAGFICDQKTRLESCEGYWGRVPQCPLPPENPGGQ